MNTAEPRILDADWAAIAVVVFGVTAFSVSQGLTYPLIALVLADRGVSPGIIGLNGAFFAIGVGASTFLIGPMTSLMNGQRLIVSALIGVSVSLALLASFESLWIWFAARFFLGLAASVIFMTSEAWLNTACPDRIRGRVSGLFGAGMCAGFAAGPLAIPLFGMEDGFAFALLAVYVAFVAFVTVILSRKTHTSPGAARPGMFLSFVFAAPMLVAMVLVFGFADIAAVSGLPLYFTEIGYSPSFAAVTVTMLALPTALAQPLFGYLLDKFDRNIVTSRPPCLLRAVSSACRSWLRRQPSSSTSRSSALQVSASTLRHLHFLATGIPAACWWLAAPHSRLHMLSGVPRERSSSARRWSSFRPRRVRCPSVSVCCCSRRRLSLRAFTGDVSAASRGFTIGAFYVLLCDISVVSENLRLISITPEEAGLTYGDITTSFLPPADGRAAFERGAVDAWVIWDPFQAAAEVAIEARELRNGEGIVPNHQFYLGGRPFIETHTEAVDVIIKAVGEIDEWTTSTTAADLAPWQHAARASGATASGESIFPADAGSVV